MLPKFANNIIESCKGLEFNVCLSVLVYTWWLSISQIHASGFVLNYCSQLWSNEQVWVSTKGGIGGMCGCWIGVQSRHCQRRQV